MTTRSGDTEKRQVGSELIEFDCSQAWNNYCCSSCASDDSNNNRQGYLSFEEVFLLNDWN